ncbi:hypothetical protein SDC9_105580 [bioreactor metagenome]|uniref:Uncharacterized protein n=1 Tax=bioreactor metagenome TaxID=1076179 RepID=A0A645B004_9ZZZZ
MPDHYNKPAIRDSRYPALTDNQRVRDSFPAAVELLPEVRSPSSDQRAGQSVDKVPRGLRLSQSDKHRKSFHVFAAPEQYCVDVRRGPFPGLESGVCDYADEFVRRLKDRLPLTVHAALHS